MMGDTGLPSYADVYFATDEAVASNADDAGALHPRGRPRAGTGRTPNPEESCGGRPSPPIRHRPQRESSSRRSAAILSLSFDADHGQGRLGRVRSGTLCRADRRSMMHDRPVPERGAQAGGLHLHQQILEANGQPTVRNTR